MSQLLPIIEELADCETDAQRADWLLRVPVGVICRDGSAIRRILMEARFTLGVQAFDLEFAALNATRLADGGLPQTVVLGVQAVRSFLREIVRKGGPQ
ncbi:hypothetical protein [Rhizobium rhizogenes]|uniref:hypothetical protein n=1 Tax=Rhizobium rhizogenes TaxID=359 RepID=UPI0015737A5D|nr:hypothetical protein [Rhizobium rhizogenes]NTF92573.1 hypothetical protein [Rhizobium rhizogenes]